MASRIFTSTSILPTQTTRAAHKRRENTHFCPSSLQPSASVPLSIFLAKKESFRVRTRSSGRPLAPTVTRAAGEEAAARNSSMAVLPALVCLWNLYLSALAAHPLPTKAVTSMVLSGAGDLICQVVIEKSPRVSLARLARICVLGLLLIGPALHYWYQFLNTTVSSTGNMGALIRLLADQFIFSPIIIVVFFSSLLTLEGHSGDIPAKLRQDWLTTVLTNWQLWIPFQFLNFRFIPPNLQVGAANFMGLIWNVYLSYRAHMALDHQLVPNTDL